MKNNLDCIQFIEKCVKERQEDIVRCWKGYDFYRNFKLRIAVGMFIMFLLVFEKRVNIFYIVLAEIFLFIFGYYFEEMANFLRGHASLLQKIQKQDKKFLVKAKKIAKEVI